MHPPRRLSGSNLPQPAHLRPARSLLERYRAPLLVGCLLGLACVGVFLFNRAAPVARSEIDELIHRGSRRMSHGAGGSSGGGTFAGRLGLDADALPRFARMPQAVRLGNKDQLALQHVRYVNASFLSYHIPPSTAALNLLYHALHDRCQRMPPHAAVVDVGAGPGDASLLAAALGCDVLAFESQLRCVDVLSHVAAAQGLEHRLSVVTAPVSDEGVSVSSVYGTDCRPFYAPLENAVGAGTAAAAAPHMLDEALMAARPPAAAVTTPTAAIAAPPATAVLRSVDLDGALQERGIEYVPFMRVAAAGE
jgi:hypothetical protein